MSQPTPFRYKRNFAGSYKVYKPCGTLVATIESAKVAELPAADEWLVTFYRWDSCVEAVVGHHGEIGYGYADCKRVLANYFAD